MYIPTNLKYYNNNCIIIIKLSKKKKNKCLYNLYKIIKYKENHDSNNNKTL